MRILSITAQKPDSTGSGVYLTELVKGFQKLGHEQAVVAGVTKEDKIQLPEGVAVFPVYYQTEELPFPVCGMSDEMPYESTKYSDMTEKMTKQYRKAYSEVVSNAVEAFQPDIILCHHLYFLTSIVRELCPKVKVYAISHGSDLRQMQKNPWQREFIKKNIQKLDKVFALHEEQKEGIIEIYQCDADNIEVIGTGYNSDVFFITSEIQKQSAKTRLIFAGKISEKKGVMSMLRAFSYIPNAQERFTLALAGGYGNEAEYAEICKLAEECPCDVEFLGKLPQGKLAEELNKSDVFMLPSFFEGLPLVIIEAMACGLRVVCTDLPGIKPWINANIPDNGVVFVEPPVMENADEPVQEFLPEFEKRLANAIECVMDSNLPRQEAVQKISWDGLCKRLEQWYNN